MQGKGNRRSNQSNKEKKQQKPFKKNGTRPRARSKDDGLIRLNKYIAHSGICSRREADEYISTGLVSVDGKVTTELGTKVEPSQDVRVNGRRIKPERKIYILINKPKDCITTTRDRNAKYTVMDLIRDATRERVFPVGRLDRNTTGVLLITNDGELAAKLTHPKYNKKKIYHVQLDQTLKKSDMMQIAEGIKLEDGLIQADAISYVNEDDKRQVGIEIHSGRNRIVRRIFEHLGYKISKLDRVYFAGLTKKSLSRGKWRFLTDKEIARLKMNSYQ